MIKMILPPAGHFKSLSESLTSSPGICTLLFSYWGQMHFPFTWFFAFPWRLGTFAEVPLSHQIFLLERIQNNPTHLF